MQIYLFRPQNLTILPDKTKCTVPVVKKLTKSRHWRHRTSMWAVMRKTVILTRQMVQQCSETQLVSRTKVLTLLFYLLRFNQTLCGKWKGLYVLMFCLLLFSKCESLRQYTHRTPPLPPEQNRPIFASHKSDQTVLNKKTDVKTRFLKTLAPLNEFHWSKPFHVTISLCLATVCDILSCTN